MDVGTSIRDLRLARGLTQEGLAAALYVSRQTISHWESGRTVPDAQSLLLMSALFDVTVDELVKGGVETMAAVEVQERRRARVSYAAAAGIGLAGAALVAAPLVSELGPLGGALSLVPVATALAVAGVSRAQTSTDASLSVLREALESNVELLLHAEGCPHGLEVAVLDEKNEQPYLVRHTASVPRGERGRIEDATGRRVARVAYRVIMTAAPLPSLEANVDGVGTITARKNLRMREGIAQVWELAGCDVCVAGDWLGEKVELTQGGRPIASLDFEGADARLRMTHGRHVLLALTLAFLLLLVRAKERRHS